MKNTTDLAYLENYLSGIINNIPFGMITLSSSLELDKINANALKYLAFHNTDLQSLKKHSYKNIFVCIPEIIEQISAAISSEDEINFDIANIDVNKHNLCIKVRTIFDGVLVLIEDITQQVKLEKQLKIQAENDSLTKLPNRAFFEKNAEILIKKSLQNNTVGVVMFIDLDRFKPVNDTAGHAAGDLLLMRISTILKSHIRSRDILARIGGDEFALILDNCSLSRGEIIAEKMRRSIEEFVFVYENYSFNISISAGMTFYGNKNDTFTKIMDEADTACNMAKNSGRNNIYVIDKNDDKYEEHKKEVSWIPKIHNAIEYNHFVLYKQEIKNLFYEDIKHYEILIRLKDEDGNIIPPNSFIPSAERYDMMPQIDKWVIESAFKSLKENVSYSINLSGQTIVNLKIAKFIESLVYIYEIDPNKITFEITETAAIQNFDTAMIFINKLKNLGFTFSLDDFGSGLSSFTYLKDMPVDYLKIDGSFVKEIVESDTSHAMVMSINEIGNFMGLKVIAEYVENAAILKELEGMGINYAQGYYIHKPDPL